MELTEEENEDLMRNYAYYIDHRNEAEKHFKNQWKDINDYNRTLWFPSEYTSHWTKEDSDDLRNNYFYYIDHRNEAESIFKIVWRDIEWRASLLKLKCINGVWTRHETSDLIENYNYYVDNIEDAKKHFRRKWSVIYKRAVNLGLSYDSWTSEHLGVLRENYFFYLNHKKEAEVYFRKSWDNICTKAVELKITSMKINKKCSLFLGCHVAERVLSHVFKDTQRMPIHNPGFDFICNKGHKIDSKASCLRKNNTYQFAINQNKIADYFLCIGFDNRESLNPQYIWLIKGDEMLWDNKMLNEHVSLVIPNTIKGLSKVSKYELTDKLKETIECCNTLKNVNDSNKVNTQSER